MTYDTNQPSRPKLNGRRVPISTYLEEDDYDKLLVIAQAAERPLAAEIRLAVRNHIAADQKAA